MFTIQFVACPAKVRVVFGLLDKSVGGPAGSKEAAVRRRTEAIRTVGPTLKQRAEILGVSEEVNFQ
jgi:hypothetical protein